MAFVSCIWLLVSVLNEDVEVSSRSIAELMLDVYDVPFGGPFFGWEMWVVGPVVDFIARFVRHRFELAYFKNREMDLAALQGEDDRERLLRAWHDTGNKCFRHAVLFTLVLFGGTVFLTSLVPHRRAATVVHCTAVAFLTAVAVFPLLMTLVVGGGLCMARNGSAMDGLISYFPEMMDLQSIDVFEPRFFAWRLMQIEKEAAVLAQIYSRDRKLTNNSDGDSLEMTEA
jgi:hypothetical protein